MIGAMRILAIDTSCGACSAAVFDGAARVALARRSEPMAHGQAVALGPMVEAVMGEVEGGFASLGQIAVAIGPGSFTGIRIGLAMARAIALTLGVPVVGVSTLVAFAAPLLDEPQAATIVSAIDARHGSCYFQAFAAEAQRIGIPSEALGAAFPDIVAIARIGLAADPTDWPARPLYVKPPDAKPANADAIARVEG